MISKLAAALRKFFPDTHASITMVVSLSLIPLSIGTGVAVDLGRTLTVKGKLQAAMDSAVITGLKIESGTSNTYATSMFINQGAYPGVQITTPVFTTNADKSFSGTVTATVPMTLLSLVGKNNLTLNIHAKASAPVVDDSCILSLGNSLTVNQDSLTLNGGSNLNLSGCKLRSNTSMTCNGHSGNADASYAAGTVDNKCANPYPNSPVVPDIHAALASNVSKQCGLTSNSVTWTVGGPQPSSPNMITVVNGSVTEYHICGTLTVSGTGTLLGNASADSLLVIENGDLVISNNADVTLTRAGIVLTGSSGSHTIDYPNGNGKSATLRISTGTANGNPWRGIGIYQDPTLTSSVNVSWGPGANLYADGVLYFPNSNVTVSGNMTTAGDNCTKLVTNTFTSNGSVDLSQSTAACATVGLKQYQQTTYLMN
jgi:hypothetical protein